MMVTKRTSRSVIKLPMEQAAAALVAMGIQTYDQFLVLCNQGNRPDFIPRSLREYYPEYPGWDAFYKLGQQAAATYGVIEGIKYDALKSFIHDKGINTKGAYISAHRNNQLPPGAPLDPEVYYEDFEGWSTFLASKKKQMTYEAAKKIIHPFGLKSSYQWRNFCREGKKPDFIPVLPDRDFPDFVSWPDFLGYSPE